MIFFPVARELCDLRSDSLHPALPPPPTPSRTALSPVPRSRYIYIHRNISDRILLVALHIPARHYSVTAHFYFLILQAHRESNQCVTNSKDISVALR